MTPRQKARGLKVVDYAKDLKHDAKDIAENAAEQALFTQIQYIVAMYNGRLITADKAASLKTYALEVDYACLVAETWDMQFGRNCAELCYKVCYGTDEERKEAVEDLKIMFLREETEDV